MGRDAPPERGDRYEMSLHFDETAKTPRALGELRNRASSLGELRNRAPSLQQLRNRTPPRAPDFLMAGRNCIMRTCNETPDARAWGEAGDLTRDFG